MTPVSVILPVFNNKTTLERAIFSVINEPYVLEILIVDDGSKDGSIQIVQEFADKYSNIKFLQHPNGENRGGSASRNFGLSKSKSDWIQFLDADDELLEGKIKNQLLIVKEGMSFVVGNAIDCFDDGHQHLRKFISDPWAGLLAGKLGITSANLWNKGALLKIGGWDESLASSQEYNLMFRLLQENDQVGFCNQALTKIHKTSYSISNNPRNKNIRIQNWLNLRKEVKSYLEENKMFTFFRSYTYSGYLLDFCKKNEIMESYNGSMVLGFLFQIEKSFKKKIYNWFEKIRQ